MLWVQMVVGTNAGCGHKCWLWAQMLVGDTNVGWGHKCWLGTQMLVRGIPTK